MFVKPFTSISGGKYSAGSMSTSSSSFTALRVLRAVEPLRGDVSDLRMGFRVRVDRGLERRDQRVRVGGFRLRIAGRRHQMPAQLTDRGLEDFRVLRNGLGRHALERHVAGEVVLVVTIRAVGPKECPAPLLAGMLHAEDGHGRRHRDAGDGRSDEPCP